MGLDTVELIMSVEDAFAISITDQQASKCETISQLCDIVLGAPTTSDRSDESDRTAVLQRIYMIVGEQMNIDPALLTPETNFVRDL